MTILDIIKKRYATKNFSGEKISDDVLEALKESIRLAPSSFNWQPWKIKIIDDPKTLKELQKYSWDQPQVGSASHLFIFCSVQDIDKNNERLLLKMKDNIPKDRFDALKSMTEGALKNMTEDDKEKMSERELFMPVENLLLTATDLGYAACPMGGFQADKYSEILKIPKDLKPIVIVPVGIPVDEPRKKIRFDYEEIFF